MESTCHSVAHRSGMVVFCCAISTKFVVLEAFALLVVLYQYPYIYVVYSGLHSSSELLAIPICNALDVLRIFVWIVYELIWNELRILCTLQKARFLYMKWMRNLHSRCSQVSAPRQLQNIQINQVLEREYKRFVPDLSVLAEVTRSSILGRLWWLAREYGALPLAVRKYFIVPAMFWSRCSLSVFLLRDKVKDIYFRFERMNMLLKKAFLMKAYWCILSWNLLLFCGFLKVWKNLFRTKNVIVSNRWF